jgi:putative SOS response-associated peptidase YedK
VCRAFRQLLRERGAPGRHAPSRLVRIRRDAAACFFAGVWTRWTSVRKIKEGETTNDIFAFLTTEANKVVGAIHAKAMPVILMTREEIDTWMTAPPEEALKLQRPVPDDALMIVARGEKKDEGGLAA